MDTILIVDDNKQILEKMHGFLSRFRDEFRVITANDGGKAINLMKETNVDLLITDLVMPQTDGLTLLAYINERYPRVLCIAMTGYATENIIRMLPDNLLCLVRKPFKLYELLHIIRKGIKTKSPAGTVRGISIPSFLQLIEMDEKSCALDVTLANDKKGTFLFKGGILYEAVFGDMTGEEAAMEILKTDEKAKVTLNPLPKQNIPRRINSRTMDLLLKSAWCRDTNTCRESSPPAS